jgi:hypothetical protein
MNPFASSKWIKRHVPRRNKRVARLGGYPAPGPELPVESFQPVLNHQQRLDLALGWVNTLGRESVDEATGDPLDNLVNAHSDDWQRRLVQQYRAYCAAALSRVRRSQAIAEQYRYLWEQDQKRLDAAEIAVEHAVLSLSGEPPMRTAGRRAAAPRDDTQPRRAARQATPGTRTSAEQRDQDLLSGPAAMARPPVSRTELRRLLAPADANRVPHWQETGFRDGALLGGRPLGTYAHALALIIAAGADIGAFTQVVELALPNQSNWVVYLVVGGLTSVVLYIAHMIGVMLRHAKAQHLPGTGRGRRVWSWLAMRGAIVGCSAVWVALGLLAYWVRKTVPLVGTATIGGGGIGSGAVGGGAGTGTGNYTPQSAAIFLGLYLATGIVAAVGAFFTHNPYRSRYTAALRGYRKASDRAAASVYQFLQADAAYIRQRAELEAARQIYDAAVDQERAFSEQLKQSVRLQIARMAGDPAVTDAIFAPDQKPYWGGQRGSSPGPGQGAGVPKP